MALQLYERPNGILHIRGTVQGRIVDQSARTRVRAEAEAIRVELEADLFRRAVYGDRAVATFSEAVVRYLNADGSTDHLTGLLLKIGHRKLSEIDQAFVDALAKERPGMAPATLVRQIYTPISAVMNFAAESKLCEVVRFRKPTVKNGRLDYLTPVEAETLLGFLPDHMKRIVTFYLATGCRATEALDLDWRDVSPEGERVVFWDTKTGERGVDLQKRARKMLPEWRDGLVWRNSEGEPWHAYSGVALMLKRHCERNGFRHVTPHVLRHTWATWAYSCTRDLTFLMQSGGWRSATMVMRYAHAASDDMARSVLSHGWEFFGREVVRPRLKSRKA